ncbi:MAG TPA: UMP kinase [Candidatus Krumholzibacteria bacterium]|nr:UMP kinase [Candidatus Krumholzibacteria bacterium]
MPSGVAWAAPREDAVVSNRYSRILLKLSGEALAADGDPFGHEKLAALARVIADLVEEKVQIAVVVGAGNLFRARSANLDTMNRVTADHVGMLATMMNAAVLRDYLRAEGTRAVVLTPDERPPLGRAFSRDRALPLLQDRTVLIFGGGTGNPYFTTDSAAALRALEIQADILLKGTQVDGVYDKDPKRHADAVRYDTLSFDVAIDRRLRVMDLTALALCEENAMPIMVFDISDPDNLRRVVRGELEGTLVTKESAR